MHANLSISNAELALARARDPAAWAAHELPRKLDDLCKLREPATFYQSSHPDALSGNDTEVFTIELDKMDIEDDGRVIAATFIVKDTQTAEFNKVQFWERSKGGWGAWVNGHKHRDVVENIAEFIDRHMEMPGRETRALLRDHAKHTAIISTRETDLRNVVDQPRSMHM
jgi:hypothetical protein